MKKSFTRIVTQAVVLVFIAVLIPVLAAGAVKTSLSSGIGADASRWSSTAGTGTISSDGSVVVTGSGTVFTTQLFGASAPSILSIGGQVIGVIASITDDTRLTLTAPPAGGAFSPQSFTHQTVPMPGDNVTIAAGHAVTILGWSGLTINDLTISGTASLECDCDLFNVTGNIVVDGMFKQNAGCRIIMDGVSSTIGGSNTPVVLRSLRVKTTFVAAHLTLNGPVIVTDKLDMENGTINLNAHTLTIGTSAIAPAVLLLHPGAYQYINGPGNLTRWFAPGSSAVTDNSSIFPITIGDSNRNAWIAGVVTVGGTVAVTQTELSGTTPITVNENSRTYINRLNMYWVVSPGNGFTATALSLRLQASGLPGVVAVGDLTMSGMSGAAAGQFAASTTGAAPADYQVNRSFADQTQLAGSYSIAVTADSPLPVELVSFGADVSGRAVVLRWKTAIEKNNYGFEIERRANGSGDDAAARVWKTIGFAEGHGTTNAPQSYSFVDNSASGEIAYRLKQIDRDGKFEMSKIVDAAVTVPGAFTLSQNYPNPFNPSTTIQFTVPFTGTATLKIFTTLGQEIMTLYRGEAQAGRYNRVQFDASRLTAGVYYSRLEYDGKVQLKQMLLIK